MSERIFKLPVPEDVLSKRKKGYEQELRAVGRVSADGAWVTLTEDQIADIRVRFSLQPVGVVGMVKGLLDSAGQLISSAMDGTLMLRSEEEQAKCLAICHQCEFWVGSSGRCAKCGCYMSLKSKLNSWHCPLEPPKW